MIHDKSEKFINKEVNVIIDRPIGSLHPIYSYKYPVNYGFIPDTKAPDGKELDAYVLGINKPIKTFNGICVAVIRRLDDDDDKLIVTPHNMVSNDELIKKLTYFQEQYFKSEIIRTP